MKTLLSGAFVALSILAAQPAAACSTCKCGDYTITLMGAERPYQDRLRASLDYVLRTESAGEPGVEEETTDESRLMLGLAYGVSENLMLGLQAPYVRKVVEATGGESEDASGLGDIDLVGRWVMFRSGEMPSRNLAGLRLGVRLPTAEQVRDGSGALHEIHLQPDAGATAPNVGAWYSHIRYPWLMSASATYYSFGEGNQGFAPGNVLHASLQGQYALTQSLALQAGLDARQSEHNFEEGARDENSGGFLAMAYAGAALRVGEDLLLNLGVQLPAVENLNGHQDEGTNVRAGVTFDF